MPPGSPKLAVLTQAAAATEQEKALAKALDLSLLTEVPADLATTADFCLQFSEQGLTIRATARGTPAPLGVDFTTPRLLRRSRESLKKQNLGKAIGLKRDYVPIILDAAAGLGSDAFLMAMAGCHVTMLERSPVVAALLQDGLIRAAASAEAVHNAIQRMELVQTDFINFETATREYDVVYLDPMFPDESRRARSKKPMWVLQQLLPKAEDEESLLQRALLIAGRRVVVKRARHSPQLPGTVPDIQFRGSSSRYDVYLTGTG